MLDQIDLIAVPPSCARIYVARNMTRGNYRAAWRTLAKPTVDTKRLQHCSRIDIWIMLIYSITPV